MFIKATFRFLHEMLYRIKIKTTKEKGEKTVNRCLMWKRFATNIFFKQGISGDQRESRMHEEKGKVSRGDVKVERNYWS